MTCLVWDSVEQTVWSLFVFHWSTLQQCHNRSQTTSEAPPGCLEHTRCNWKPSTFNLTLVSANPVPSPGWRFTTVIKSGPIWSSELFRCRALGSRYGHRSSFAVEPRDSSATEPAHWSPNIDQISDSTLGFEPDYGNSIIDNLGSKLRKYFDGHNFKLLLWYRYPGASTSMDINYSEQMTWDDQSTLAWGVRRKVLTESANYGGIGIHKLHQHTSFPPW